MNHPPPCGPCNRVQERFDRSIREAVEATRKAKEREDAARPKRTALPKMTATEKRGARRVRKGYRMYRDPETGGTVWGPK